MLQIIKLCNRVPRLLIWLFQQLYVALSTRVTAAMRAGLLNKGHIPQVKSRSRCSNNQQLSQKFPRDLKQHIC